MSEATSEYVRNNTVPKQNELIKDNIWGSVSIGDIINTMVTNDITKTTMMISLKTKPHEAMLLVRIKNVIRFHIYHTHSAAINSMTMWSCTLKGFMKLDRSSWESTQHTSRRIRIATRHPIVTYSVLLLTEGHFIF